MSEIAVPGYGKVVALGHSSVADIFDGPVEVTEKIDGSQFAFGVVDGELYMRSKGRQIPANSVEPNDLFYNTVRSVEARHEACDIPDGWWFYGEALRSEKHSTLTYGRVPEGHFVLWAARYQDNEATWMRYPDLAITAMTMQVEPVRRIVGLSNAREVLEYMQGNPESQLGGKAEGVVVKNLERPMQYGPLLLPISSAKFVSEQFKEVHEKNWSKDNTARGKWDAFMDRYRTEARWQKAIQRRAEAGELLGEPKDIGELLKAVQQDIAEECKEEIQAFLWREYGKTLLRHSVKGLPEWYKEQIALGNINQYLGD